MTKKGSESKPLVTVKRRSADRDGQGTIENSSAMTALGNVGQSLSRTTAAAADVARSAATSIARSAKKSAVVGKKTLVQAGGATARAGRAVGKAVGDAGGAVARSAGVVGTTLLDLNNDGKIDEEDLRLATERGIALAKQVAEELASSETIKSTGKAGIVVATIAIPVPLVGPATGFVVGAGGYLTVKAVKEIGEAIGTAVGGVHVAPPSRRRKSPTKARR